VICPICEKESFQDLKEFPAYKVCDSCGFCMQETLPKKVYEGPKEGGVGPKSGHLMSDHDKAVNRALANALYQIYSPKTVLDIGSKYPYFLSCIKDRAYVLALDGIEDVLKYGEELGVNAVCEDFEEMDVVEFSEWLKGKFDLVTLIHVVEHFYHPIETMKKVNECLSDEGIVFVRLPNIDIEGVNRHLTDHHLSIHPYIYSTASMDILADKVGLEIFKVDHLPGAGQSDFYLRKRRVVTRIGKSIKLSVCMIAKNEAENITDALNSIKNIANEIIVVDTGSTDDTKKVVGKFKNVKIYDFLWVDDFAAARNYSLRKATGEWLLWMDCDDVVENPEEILKMMKEPYDSFGCNLLYGSEVFQHSRLFRNGMGIHFRGRVHEYPVLIGRNKKFSDLNVRHKTHKVCAENRGDRNLRILLKENEDNPNDSRTLFYLATSLKDVGRFDEAVGMFLRYQHYSTFAEEKFMSQKYIGQTYMQLKMYTLAIEAFEKCAWFDAGWKEPIYYIGECYFYLGRYEDCVKKMYECINLEEKKKVLWKETTIYSHAPYRYLFACFDIQGNYLQAWKHAKKAFELCPDDEWLKNRVEYFYGLMPKSEVKDAIKVIECYRWGAIGDCLMTTAALRGLKEKYKGCKIRYITHPNNFGILEGNKYIDELVSESKFDADVKIYFSYPDKNSSLKNEGWPEKPLSRHLVKIFNECAGLPDNSMDLECTLSSDEEMVGMSTARFSKPIFKGYVTMHIQSGWSVYKDWIYDRWVDIAKYLREIHYMPVQIGGIQERLLPEVSNFIGRSFKEAVSLIKHSDLHIGIDSFTNHASFAVKKKSIILFGSTEPIGFGYDQNVNIYKGIDCQPCHRENPDVSKVSGGECPIDGKCMKDISVEDVKKEIDNILGVEVLCD